MNSNYLTPFAFEQITVSSVSIGFTQTTAYRDGGITADFAVVTVETNAIRSRDDGTAPTASVGIPWNVSDKFTVCGLPSIKAVRFIRQTADATISVSYYREN
jgi:hypothetical protein